MVRIGEEFCQKKQKSEAVWNALMKCPFQINKTQSDHTFFGTRSKAATKLSVWSTSFCAICTLLDLCGVNWYTSRIVWKKKVTSSKWSFPLCLKETLTGYHLELCTPLWRWRKYIAIAQAAIVWLVRWLHRFLDKPNIYGISWKNGTKSSHLHGDRVGSNHWSLQCRLFEAHRFSVQHIEHKNVIHELVQYAPALSTDTSYPCDRLVRCL